MSHVPASLHRVRGEEQSAGTTATGGRVVVDHPCELNREPDPHAVTGVIPGPKRQCLGRRVVRDAIGSEPELMTVAEPEIRRCDREARPGVQHCAPCRGGHGEIDRDLAREPQWPPRRRQPGVGVRERERQVVCVRGGDVYRMGEAAREVTASRQNQRRPRRWQFRSSTRPLCAGRRFWRCGRGCEQT